MHLGETYDEEFKKKNPYDVEIKTSGFSYKTEYMKTHFNDCLNVHN